MIVYVFDGENQIIGEFVLVPEPKMIIPIDTPKGYMEHYAIDFDGEVPILIGDQKARDDGYHAVIHQEAKVLYQDRENKNQLIEMD